AFHRTLIGTPVGIRFGRGQAGGLRRRVRLAHGLAPVTAAAAPHVAIVDVVRARRHLLLLPLEPRARVEDGAVFQIREAAVRARRRGARQRRGRRRARRRARGAAAGAGGGRRGRRGGGYDDGLRVTAMGFRAGRVLFVGRVQLHEARLGRVGAV